MILSISRRTDIPAFYTPWLLQRLREGFVLVRNPMNYHQVSRVSLAPEVVDGIVFWSKNPAPLLPHLPGIGAKYPFYLQYTLTGYGKDIEPCLPSVEARLDTLRQVAEQFGADKVVWRYDPVLLTEKYNLAWHRANFDRLAAALAGKVDTCVFSLLDMYPKIEKNLCRQQVRTCTAEETAELAAHFARTAAANGIRLQSCAEAVDLAQYGISHGSCVDGERLSRLCGYELNAKKDKNQRAECGCLESIDLGQYNTCRHGCLYCYANFNEKSVQTLSARHDPASPLLIGQPEPTDKVTERKMKSLKTGRRMGTEQLVLF